MNIFSLNFIYILLILISSFQIRLPSKTHTVCLKTFAGVHGITQARVRRLAEARLTSICSPVDMRGKQPNPHKISDAVKKQIDDHIRTFPVMRSHYSRSHHGKRRKYLSPLLSVATMHELYKENHESGDDVSYEFYLNYFNSNFNLSFGHTKSDTCGTCDQFKVQIEAANDTDKPRLLSQQEDHHREAENFYSSLRTDTKLAKQNNHIATITVDFQQNLPLPHIAVGEVFYMHQLWLYVFGVHSCGNNHAEMFCWPEFVARKGSDKVISCLDSFLSTLPSQVTTVYLYSDGCPGQNKNVNVIHYLFSLIRLGRFRHIQHHFPVRGHSFLPNDRDFGRTEARKKKVQQVFTPEQWYEVITKARKTNPFVATPVSQDKFKSFSQHLSPLFKKSVTVNRKPLGIQRTRIFDYSSEHPDELWVKYSTEEDTWTKYKIEKKKNTPFTHPTEPKYVSPIPLKSTKVADIRKLVDKYVPAEYKEVYSSIVAENDVSSETDESETD